ncbi:MAG: hypothetical protein WCP74_13285 [Sphingobacteriia bacterium]|jgi:hypothetical protein
MAINKNHEFEELDGIKCAIVEKNAPQARVDFLKKLLSINGFEVVVVPSPAPKAAPAPAAAAPAADAGTENAATPPATTQATEPPAVEAPSSFTIGVTDYTFNSTNAVFGRLLKTPQGHVVTQAYWLQKEGETIEEVPYYDFK